MSEIKVNTTAMRQYANRLGSVCSRLTKLNGRMNNLYKNSGLIGLRKIINASIILDCKSRLFKAQNYLNETAREFELVEANLSNQNPMNFDLNKAYIHDIISNIKDKNFGRLLLIKELKKCFRENSKPVVMGKAASIWDDLINGDISENISGAVHSKGNDDKFRKLLVGALGASVITNSGYEYDDAFNEKLKDILSNKNINFPEQDKKDHYQKNKDESFYKKNGTILDAEAEAKAEGSVLDGKISGDSKYAEGSLEGKVLTGEAHASAAAGLYVYEKDKDGNTKRIFSPGVNAEVGASASVLEGSAEGRIGLGKDKNALGVYGGAEAKVLTAEAKAKVAANRKEVFAGASAEADVAKVSAHGGASVLGTDVGVSGSVKFGIGAHANVGYTDGKVKVDVGAALGLGADVGFEVDVSGTVKGISNGVKAVCKGARSAWNSFF